MWLTELIELEKEFKKYRMQRKARQMGIKIKKSKKK